MGLDITVYRPIKVTDTEKMEDYYVLSEMPELEVFKDLAFEKENSYYDLEAPIKLLGREPEDFLCVGASYGKEAAFSYLDSKHELYEAYEFLSNNWSDVYFEQKEELFASEIFKEYTRRFSSVMKKFDYRPRYKYFASGNMTTYYNLNSAMDFSEKLVKIIIIDPPTENKIETCIGFEEVGYQRKGANKKFYEDGMWDSPCVVDSKTLNEHWEKYFSNQTPESKGGWGSGVEYNKEDTEMREDFKRNIIDKFVEGETFVIYH
jgi:hypothetical protein